MCSDSKWHGGRLRDQCLQLVQAPWQPVLAEPVPWGSLRPVSAGASCRAVTLSLHEALWGVIGFAGRALCPQVSAPRRSTLDVGLSVS